MIEIEVTKKQVDCAKDLEKAEPALKAAGDALNTLNKVDTKCLLKHRRFDTI